MAATHDPAALAVAEIRRRAVALAGLDDVAPIVERIGDAATVLLGEATHGTHEFYRLRAEITKRLIVERGFDAMAVEADWPDALRVSRWLRGAAADPNARRGGSDATADTGTSPYASPDAALGGFARFPRWMWRNEELRAFIGWLRGHNAALAEPARRVGFYGLDLYSLDASMRAVVQYLQAADPAAALEARRRYDCFDNLAADPQRYGMETRFGRAPDCEREALRQLQALFEQAGRLLRSGGGAAAADELFYAQQNARVVRNAERYYRTMFGGATESWNQRDTHMAETLQRLREHLRAQRPDGRPAKVVVWAHNSHVGDARATQWAERGQISLGQLVRERPDGGADDEGGSFLLGFTTHDGRVAAASDWDAPVELKTVLPSRADSWERLLHEAGGAGGLFLLPLGGGADAALRGERLGRAIGVIYRPETERASHYFRASLARQFDAVVHVDRSRALRPLDRPTAWPPAQPQQHHGAAETWPSGL